MPELSIVIPIYNTPTDALVRCFHSIEALDPGIDREVLLIDDGSGPEIGQFCREFIETHPTFRYIRQENGGVSSARNTGMEHAQGQYLTFLDADDTLIPQPFTPALLQESHDLVIFDILLQYGDSQSVWHALEQPGTLSQKALFTQLILSKSLNSPCAKLFKMHIIRENGLRFDTAFVTGEDWNFVCDYVQQIQQAYYPQTASYLYFKDRGTSLGRLARFPDKMLDNQIAMYRRKHTLISQFLADRSRDLLCGSAIDLAENLFNTACSLISLKLLTEARKTRIRREIADAKVYFTERTPRKTRMKTTISQKHFYLLRPIAALRRLYLKLKH